MLRPPTTNDPALNRFLEEVASTIQDRVRPEEGWTLSDFASSVSEVISDKRDLIDIVTQYDNIEGLSEVMEAEIARLKADIQGSMDLLSSVDSKSAQFAAVMEWWDQNYTVIFEAQEALSIFQQIHGAMAEHQDLLSQTTAAKEAAEQAAAGIIAAGSSAEASAEAAKTSETNATDAAARAEAIETEVSEAREYVSGVHEDLSPGGHTRTVLEWLANFTEDQATTAEQARDAAEGHADRAEAAADRVGTAEAVLDAADRAGQSVSDAGSAADRAENAALSVEKPVQMVTSWPTNPSERVLYMMRSGAQINARIGSQWVWSIVDTVVIPDGGSGVSTHLSLRGLSASTVTKLPFRVDFLGATSLSSAFSGFSSLATLQPISAPLATNLASAFWGCSSLESIDLNVPAATSLSSTFRDCSSLESIDLNVPAATNLSSTFRDCSSLESIDLNVPAATNLSSTFQGCSSLTSVTLDGYGPAVTSAFNGRIVLTDTQITPAAADRLMTGLGTPPIAVEIRLPSTAQGCDTNIATAKNWTVTVG